MERISRRNAGGNLIATKCNTKTGDLLRWSRWRPTEFDFRIVIAIDKQQIIVRNFEFVSLHGIYLLRTHKFTYSIDEFFISIDQHHWNKI